MVNSNKSKCIAIFRNKEINKDAIPIPNIVLDDVEIEYVAKVRILAVIFNSTPSWNDHIHTVIGKVYGMLRAMWTTQNFTAIKIRMLLVKQFLIPTLLYGCEFFSNCDFLRKRKLNVTYNNFARYLYVFELKRFDHVQNMQNKFSTSLLIISWIFEI